MDTPFIRTLNQAQLNAATCKSKAVQILAGPGSGKTRVLTSRVAWLVLAENVKPQHIVVVTFTNKAAREMRERLEKPELLGQVTSGKLFMGTFHSLCARLLRQYYAYVNLKPNFTIADVDVSKSVIKKLMKELGNQLSNYARTHMKPDAFWNAISAARNEGMNVDEYIAKNQNEFTKKDICVVFRAYEDRMHADNYIDFDNLLLYTRVLLRKHPGAANFVRHVLVDEFQDTNSVQYDIVKGLTQGGKSLTIVGDPDQSIFGWRNADRENFIKMQNEYRDTTVCNLEENYRSTKKILTAAFHVVNKDRDRIQKSLFTDNAEGVPMSLLKMSDDTMECQSVAEEIKRLVEYSGGLIKYKDIAILVRMSFLSNGFEQALNALSIPYVVIGGVKFFERAEVKDVLAYLRFFYNRNDTEAFERIINKPKRGVGEVTMDKIEKMSRSKNTDIIQVLREICSGKAKGVTIPAKTKQNLQEFVDLYDSAQAMINNRDYIYKILEHIITKIHFKQYLQMEFKDKDGESRWDNVGELITYAKRFDPPPNNSAQLSAAAALAGADLTNKEEGSQGYSQEPELPEYTDFPEERHDPNDSVKSGDHIVQFLEMTTLSSNTKEEEEVEQLGKVTISTMHSAKGLEWPCVFSVASESGIIPHRKADDKEESRLLYVAMTRAKCFLYCTHTPARMLWGNVQHGSLSEFLSDMPETAYTHRTPKLDIETRAWVADVLHLPYPENCTVQHAGDDIWMSEERAWSKYDSDEVEYGYSYNRRNHFSSSRSGRFVENRPKDTTATTMTPTAASKPKPTAESVQAKPYASFGSAAFVKEDVIVDYKKTTSFSNNIKSAAGSKRKQAYGAGTAHLRKK